MPTVLITGANRGIGLGLVRQYSSLGGWTIIATCRKPGDAAELRSFVARDTAVVLKELDVCKHEQIDHLSRELAGTPIDILINNAGVGGGRTRLGDLNYPLWREILETNLFGPVRITESMIPNVLAGNQRKIIALSSSLGSISTTKGGNYLYRSSKAALNMTMRSIAVDLQKQGVIVALLSPGVVDTDLMRSVQIPKISVDESAAGLVRMIDALTLEHAGSFLRYNNQVVPW